MKRRDFLQQTGLLAAGSGRMLAETSSATGAEPETRPAETPSGRARLLITSGQDELARYLASVLRDRYDITLTAPQEVTSPDRCVPAELGFDESTSELVRTVDAVLHVARPGPLADEAGLLDARARCSYNLLHAAARQDVRLVVYLSSLSLMTAYDESFAVDEDWQPRPPPEPEALSHYLGEFVCREFAREGSLRVVVLRLGHVVPEEAERAGAADPLGLALSDAGQAVSRALEAGLRGGAAGLRDWSVFHIQSQWPGARFSVAKAIKSLGFRPSSRW